LGVWWCTPRRTRPRRIKRRASLLIPVGRTRAMPTRRRVVSFGWVRSE
jgi:hypothetical protein